jgi:F420-non-reducing hydrogenase large subunit
MVDENNKINFYDGKVSVVDPEGKRIGKYAPNEYTDWIAEHVEPWTYLKFPYLKKIGWKGFVDGKDSGVYVASPLSRLNASDGMATPLAQEEYEKFYDTLTQKEGEMYMATGAAKVVHQRLATHWARLIELLYAAERIVELATDPEIASDNFHKVPTEKPTEGVGIVEAPRGTLTHHYTTDERGVLTKVNLIVGTTNNYAAIQMSTKKAAQSLIKKGTVVTEGLTNMIEMAFRLYDPCFGCATHSLPGLMPLEVIIRAPDGEVLREFKQNC